MEKNILYTYLYNGKKVFIAFPEDMPGCKDVEGEIPSHNDPSIYPIEQYNGCETLLTSDDNFSGVYGGEKEVEYAYCKNEYDIDEYGVWSSAWVEADEDGEDDE